ncbi:hypothetical protein V7S43_013069 [Phytophthora oleae]|uniref:SCAN domain-containing protein n=1 Tax=Phytophthora oleae TaxID=2107226 RepID=A0ABD3F9Q7_9STRA
MSEITSAAVEGVKDLGGNLSAAHAIFNVVTFPFIDYALKQQCQRPRLLRRAEDAANSLDLFIATTCSCHMHAFCGRAVGDEGFGQAIQCPKCDQTKSIGTTASPRHRRGPESVALSASSDSEDDKPLVVDAVLKQLMPPLLLPQRLSPPLLPLQRQAAHSSREQHCK